MSDVGQVDANGDRPSTDTGILGLGSSTDPAINIAAAAYLDGDCYDEPHVIDWNALSEDTFQSALTELARWVDWLAVTYQIPPTVIPPCWALHPGLREDLGHLWTGWLVTRHPQLGVGMVGLDWDARREQAVARAREQVASAGCTPNHHVSDSLLHLCAKS